MTPTAIHKRQMKRLRRISRAVGGRINCVVPLTNVDRKWIFTKQAGDGQQVPDLEYDLEQLAESNYIAWDLVEHDLRDRAGHYIGKQPGIELTKEGFERLREDEASRSWKAIFKDPVAAIKFLVAIASGFGLGYMPPPGFSWLLQAIFGALQRV